MPDAIRSTGPIEPERQSVEESLADAKRQYLKRYQESEQKLFDRLGVTNIEDALKVETEIVRKRQDRLATAEGKASLGERKILRNSSSPEIQQLANVLGEEIKETHRRMNELPSLAGRVKKGPVQE